MIWRVGGEEDEKERMAKEGCNPCLACSLGHKPYKITYASDYFPELYDFAVDLIKRFLLLTVLKC